MCCTAIAGATLTTTYTTTMRTDTTAVATSTTLATTTTTTSAAGTAIANGVSHIGMRAGTTTTTVGATLRRVAARPDIDVIAPMIVILAARSSTKV